MEYILLEGVVRIYLVLLIFCTCLQFHWYENMHTILHIEMVSTPFGGWQVGCYWKTRTFSTISPFWTHIGLSSVHIQSYIQRRPHLPSRPGYDCDTRGWEWGAWQTPLSGQTPNRVKLLCWRFFFFFLYSSISLGIAFTVNRFVSPYKVWIVAGWVGVGGWVGCYWVRTTSSTNISLLATALAILSLLLCSSISPRIVVTVKRCASAETRWVVAGWEWVGGWVGS